MTSARPDRRCDVMPGKRAIASPIDASGSLPISSELTDSTIWSDLFFLLIAFCSEARKPVTTMAFLSPAGVGLALWSLGVACAAVAALATPVIPGVASCAKAGVAATTRAIGLTAAINSECEE